MPVPKDQLRVLRALRLPGTKHAARSTQWVWYHVPDLSHASLIPCRSLYCPSIAVNSHRHAGRHARSGHGQQIWTLPKMRRQLRTAGSLGPEARMFHARLSLRVAFSQLRRRLLLSSSDFN